MRVKNVCYNSIISSGRQGHSLYWALLLYISNVLLFKKISSIRVCSYVQCYLSKPLISQHSINYASSYKPGLNSLLLSLITVYLNLWILLSNDEARFWKKTPYTSFQRKMKNYLGCGPCKVFYILICAFSPYTFSWSQILTLLEVNRFDFKYNFLSIIIFWWIWTYVKIEQKISPQVLTMEH